VQWQSYCTGVETGRLVVGGEQSGCAGKLYGHRRLVPHHVGSKGVLHGCYGGERGGGGAFHGRGALGALHTVHGDLVDHEVERDCLVLIPDCEPRGVALDDLEPQRLHQFMRVDPELGSIIPPLQKTFVAWGLEN